MPPRGTDPKKLRRWTRQSRALDLRLAGYEYEEIVEVIREEFNQPTYAVSSAHTDVTTLLKQAKEEQSYKIDELRLIESRRYDRYTKALEEKIDKGDVQAITAAGTISEKRKKLWGLDAPVQLQVEEIVNNELANVLDAIQPFLSADTYKQVLNAIATVTASEDETSGD